MRMKQRYEQLELPLNETYQHHQSQQHGLPIALCHDWANSVRARMKEAGDTTEDLFIYSDQSLLKGCCRIKCVFMLYCLNLPDVNNSVKFNSLMHTHCCNLEDKPDKGFIQPN